MIHLCGKPICQRAEADMKIQRCPIACGVLLFTALTGCVSVHVDPLTSDTYPPKTNSEALQWLESEPETPYVKLARIIVTSQTADEDRLRKEILARAAMLGADAVIMGKSDVLENVIQSQ